MRVDRWFVVFCLACIVIALEIVLLVNSFRSCDTHPSNGVQIGTAQSCTRAPDGSPVCVES